MRTCKELQMAAILSLSGRHRRLDYDQLTCAVSKHSAHQCPAALLLLPEADHHLPKRRQRAGTAQPRFSPGRGYPSRKVLLEMTPEARRLFQGDVGPSEDQRSAVPPSGEVYSYPTYGAP